MTHFELVMPKMGEIIIEATILRWTKNIGDLIEIDDTLVEIPDLARVARLRVAQHQHLQRRRRRIVAMQGEIAAVREGRGDAAMAQRRAGLVLDTARQINAGA